MINTTLCYIRQGGQCLMLHRVKKENDLNQGKWIGIGGKFEDGESPEDCLLREAREETGIREVEPLSPAIQALDILPVWGHEKQGRYVTAHLHLSVGFALTAPENQPLAAKTDENSGVRWVSVRQLEQYVTEPYMLYIYRKIGARLGAF